MAAIAGVLRWDGAASAAADMAGIMSRMAHRAPDGMATLDAGDVALAHGALHATPESWFDRQPIRLGARWIVAVDGRIDDRARTARLLGMAHADLSRTGDAALFASAWARWGGELWRHVEGDFALAAWDREERSLTLLRDRIGVRPLFFARSSKLLAFASEAEALLGLDGVSRTCDEDGLAYLLADTFELDDQERTFYRDVRRLRPGWRLDATPGGQTRCSRYWQPPGAPPPRLGGARDYVEAFKEIFDEAVRCRLRSVRPPALLLSGGIDSGAVLASARRLQVPGGELGVSPLSLVESLPPVSGESSNILRLHAGMGGHLIPIDHLHGHPAFATLLAVLWDDAHPVDNSILYARLACAHVGSEGGRVVIDGVDGDSVMSSDASRAGIMAASGHLFGALREARHASRVNTYLKGMAPARILLRGVAAELQPDWLASWRYRWRSRKDGDAAAGQWINVDFARRMHLGERRLSAAVAARQRRKRWSRVEQLAWTWWNPGFVRALEGTDRTYGHFGVEARHPWCDQRVVDFFLHLPDELKACDGWTKWIAREASAPELGTDVAWYSGKSHLGTNLNTIVLEATRDRVSELLAAAQGLLAGVVAADALERLRQAWDADPAGAMTRDGYAILRLASLAGWMERYRLTIQ